MKLTILMGSPRKNGNTAALLEPFLQECAALGAETETIWLYDRSIAPCLGCMTCQDCLDGLGCVQKDDFPTVFQAMADSDVIVLATPIYAFFCTAPMKALLDRAIYAGTKNYGRQKGPRLLAGKRLASIVTCGYPKEKAADLWEDALKRFCKHGGLYAAGVLCCRDMGRPTPFLDEEKEQAARNFARTLFPPGTRGKQVHLSPRLRMAADMIPTDSNGISLVDVGTDHAYLPVWLLQNPQKDRKFVHVIAADLREGPLNRAIQTAQEAKCSGIDFRLCDGLSAVDTKEANVIVIAGMGGETIVHILKDAPWRDWTDKTLILQPMSSMPELRGWLQENGFRIEEERLAQEGETLYTAFLVRAGEMDPLRPAELWAGQNRNVPLRGAWLDQWLARIGRALEGMAQSQDSGIHTRRQFLTSVYGGLTEMKEEWEQWQK